MRHANHLIFRRPRSEEPFRFVAVVMRYSYTVFYRFDFSVPRFSAKNGGRMLQLAIPASVANYCKNSGFEPIRRQRKCQFIEGLEALMRWQHAQWGVLGPEQFIPIAEETGLINEMGFWILERACRQAVEWNQRFGTRMAMHVNVSKAQFMSEAIASQFHAVLKETGLDAELLVVEITESVIMHHTREVTGSSPVLPIHVSPSERETYAYRPALAVRLKAKPIR